jgi:IS30 family transposase
MGNDKQQCFLTLVERMTGLNRIVKLPNRTAKNVTRALISLLSVESHLFKSITFYNGTEFHSYKIIEQMFGITCYFANPHHPWERGSNENFNGLLRQCFPKGSSLSYVGLAKTLAVSEQLNNRPRKRLGFKSLKEVANAIT